MEAAFSTMPTVIAETVSTRFSFGKEQPGHGTGMVNTATYWWDGNNKRGKQGSVAFGDAPTLHYSRGLKLNSCALMKLSGQLTLYSQKGKVSSPKF